MQKASAFHYRTHAQAFSLVELSIVLVILGLLVGGVLAGRSLIRASELRSIATTHQHYISAIRAFQDKYTTIPGDMPNATSFWGQMTNCGAANPSGTGTQTCDGNNDGDIDGAVAAAQTGERFTFWQHLANEGLIEGTYTGIAGPDGGTQQAIPRVNTPASNLGNNAVWYPYTLGAVTSSYAFTFSPASNTLILGGAISNNWNYGAILTTTEAWSVDKKLDDGHATAGDVWALRWNDCTPATSQTDLQDYDLTATGLKCGLMFKDAAGY